jgi:hypothetical protein
MGYGDDVIRLPSKPAPGNAGISPKSAGNYYFAWLA